MIVKARSLVAVVWLMTYLADDSDTTPLLQASVVVVLEGQVQ